MSYIIKGADEKPILHQGKEIHAMDFTGVVKGVDLENRLLKMVGTDETRDRDGDIVKVSGWMLENFQKNPVFLWAHDYRSVPLAAAQKIVRKRNPASLEFHMRFASEGLYPFADMILNLYSEGIINASSVGFIPFKWEELSDEEKEGMSPMAEYWGGKKFTKQELLELSGCAVPSNPNALQNSVKGYGEKYGVAPEQISMMLLRSVDPIQILGAKSDDVYQELKLDKCAFEDETEPKVHPVPVQIDGVDAKGQPLAVVEAPEVKEGVEPEDPPQPEKGELSSEEVGQIIRESYSEQYGIDVSGDKAFVKREVTNIQPEIGLGPFEGSKTVISYFAMSDDGIMQLIKQEVIDSKDLEPVGKPGAVLSRKNRERLVQARDVLDEVLKDAEDIADEAGEEDPNKSGAGETTAEKTLQEELEKIKTIVNGIKESFGG